CASTLSICGKNRMQEICPCGSVRGALGNWCPYRDSSSDRRDGWVGLKPTERLRTSRGRRCRGQRNEQDHSQESMEQCARKKQRKDLTGPTLLEMDDLKTYRDFALLIEWQDH